MRTKSLLAALCLMLSTSVQAVGSFIDASDLWWNPSESGWGVNVIQQNEVLFLTFFVYGASGFPVWYSGSDVRYIGTQDGAAVYSGDLFETTGPFYVGTFDPINVRYRRVGTVTFRLLTPNSASLVYNVDTFTVGKQLTRYTWRINEVAGSFLGSITGQNTGCPTAAQNGTFEEGNLLVAVTQTSSSISIRYTGATGTCNLIGDYAQGGRFGSATGQYQCTNGTFGTFQAREIEASPQVFGARVTFNTNICTFTGKLGGVRRGI
jgi:hypothetical protein